MSTPTTAAAATPLHHHHPHHLPNSYSRNLTHQYANGSTSYRPPMPNIATPLSPYSQQSLPQLVSSSTYSISSQSALRPISSGSGRVDIHRVADMTPAHNQLPPPSPTETVSTMPAPSAHGGAALPSRSNMAAPPIPVARPPAPRRRSRGPNWEEFYKNGLPKEVIVIEDTPEPEVVAVRPAPATYAGISSSPATHSAKKRKREDDAAAYAPAHVPPRPRIPLELASNPVSSVLRDSNAYNAPTTPSHAAAAQDDDGMSSRRKRPRRVLEIKREPDAAADPLTMPYRPPQLPLRKATEVVVRVVREPRANRNIKVDDDDGHYIVVPDSDLTDNYKIIKVLGQGTFGKVVQAKDKRRNKMVAIKIIRSVQKYRDASRIELRVLQTLRLNDEDNRNRCIHLRDCFDFRGHICIVMDLLGQSVFDFLRSTSFVPFPNSHIQSFARQLLTSVAYLHDVNLIHTDLKPENILLCEDAYQTFTYSRKIPSSSTTISRTASQRRVLLNPEIRLIDFGSATFYDEYHSSVVSTRHYRAPEIILGLGWSYPCDIWSIGCILVEFFTGDALFQTHDNLEHLAMMEAVVGSRIDEHLVEAVMRATPRNGQPTAAAFFKRSVLDYPTRETGRVSKKFVKAMKPLEDIIPCTTTFYKQFLDLLRRIFVYDPDKRITAKEALQHPWFREIPVADDGTEAAKIRQQRLEMATNALID